MTRFNVRTTGSEPSRARRWHPPAGFTRLHAGGLAGLSLAAFVLPPDGLFAAGSQWPENGILCVGAAAFLAFFFASFRKHSTQCPRCREINRPAAIYCAQCGQKLPQG